MKYLLAILILVPLSASATDLHGLIRAVFPGNPDQMVAIVTCESDFHQEAYNPLSRDYGLFQINSTHVAQARKMGWDVKGSVFGNILYAKWLYGMYGTSPWNASRHCWADPNYMNDFPNLGEGSTL